MESEAYELNDNHIHEALDRLCVAQAYLDKLVADHVLIAAVPDFHSQIQEAIGQLGSLYQEIGCFDVVEDIAHQHVLQEGYLVKKPGKQARNAEGGIHET